MENNIRMYRARDGLTQEELAREVGVTRQTISALEREEYDPSLPLAYRLADRFDCGVEELFPRERE